MTKSQKNHCAEILHWYTEHKRDLPWRNTRDPYKILVSEVMLQQTQVSRVVEKYKEFLRAFPNTKRLAEAKTSDVIKAWKGLGYNRRALFLQRTAQAVRNEFKGRFPKTLDELKTLPGVGDYTARAVLSFAFEQPTPVLDTNHRKFYQKTFFGDDIRTDKELLEKAEKVVNYIHSFEDEPPPNLPLIGGGTWVYHWNQALMDWVSAHADKYKLPKQKKKKKAVPFKKTDRYVRGRIIDVLREDGSASLVSLRKRFDHITDERFERIITQLKRDQLIVQKKRSIVLP